MSTHSVVTAALLFGVGLGASQSPARGDEAVRMIDFADPSYGGRIRQIFNDAGDEHNLYHYRCVFNADGSRLVGIETPAESTDYHVTLYDADGRFLKRLFTQKEFDWTLAWDRRDPHYFYTRKGGTVFRYDVQADKAKALRSFDKPSIAGPTGLTLNQSGNRLLLRMTDNSVRTYRLPALDDERVCAIEIPTGRYANLDKLRFIGYKDFFALEFAERTPQGGRPKAPLLRIYDGVTGQVCHTLDGISIGHHDFSPDGKLAYVEGFNQQRDLKLHVVNLDGSNDRVVFTAKREQLRYVRNYHVTWPAGVNDWFLLSFFPQTGQQPASYEPYLDELVQVFVDGRFHMLARTGTTCGDNFWAQPQQSASADGTRVLFHTNGTAIGKIGYESSGTIDACILFLKR